MSLITRCPACATMFKVVRDQLRISGGWVRCGQCAEVFDASAHMVDEGALVLAGVLERQTAELQAAYQPWLALEVADAEDGWVLLVGRRP